MAHVAAEVVRVAQQVAGAGQVAHGQRRADLGTGNPVALLIGHVGQRLHLETMAHAGFAQQVDIAAALALADISASRALKRSTTTWDTP
ncbi:hypothetical protein G6F40_016453 [Rhizopus arrhizus]|nr:hypothetical protein G6F40_016453 [Rhizopus arrhizus]